MVLEPSTLGPVSDLNRMSFHQSADHVQENVKRCMECYQSCQQMILHCLQLGGDHAENLHIKLLQDCSALSAITAKFILRNSVYLSQISELCQQICVDCALDCEKFDDDQMKICAHICRNCAQALNDMKLVATQ